MLECPYEMQVILQRAANGRVRCYDPQKGKQVEPDEFVIVSFDYFIQEEIIEWKKHGLKN